MASLQVATTSLLKLDDDDYWLSKSEDFKNSVYVIIS